MEISIQQLKAAAELLLAHVEDVNGDRFSIDEDFFWAVDPGQLFDVETVPKNHTIGSLAASVENVVEVVDGNSPQFPMGWSGWQTFSNL